MVHVSDSAINCLFWLIGWTLQIWPWPQLSLTSSVVMEAGQETVNHSYWRNIKEHVTQNEPWSSFQMFIFSWKFVNKISHHQAEFMSSDPGMRKINLRKCWSCFVSEKETCQFWSCFWIVYLLRTLWTRYARLARLAAQFSSLIRTTLKPMILMESWLFSMLNALMWSTEHCSVHQ